MKKLVPYLVVAMAKEENRKVHTKRSLITIERGIPNESRLTCIGFDYENIHPEQLCDGTGDCPDKSDEFACVQVNWSAEDLPNGCRSDVNCSSNYKYQYMPTLGECVDCATNNCVPCETAPRFVDYHSCLKNCKLPTSIRQFQTVNVNFLYQQHYPHLFNFFSVENYKNGQLQPIKVDPVETRPSSRNKSRNFALRGILLAMRRETRSSPRYVVQMTRNEELGMRWFESDEFTVNIALTMKRDKQIQPGREYILTGHTDGQLDGAGRLIIDNGIFRKSKSRSIRREMRRKFG